MSRGEFRIDINMSDAASDRRRGRLSLHLDISHATPQASCPVLLPHVHHEEEAL